MYQKIYLKIKIEFLATMLLKFPKEPGDIYVNSKLFKNSFKNLTE